MDVKRKKSVKGIDYLSRNQVIHEYLSIRDRNSLGESFVEEAS